MFAIIAALSQASGIIIDKIILTRRRVEVHVFIPVLFLFLAILTAIFLPFFGKISPEIFHPKYVLLFWAMIVVAIIWNIFYYLGTKNEKVQEFEMIIMFQPLLTILLAAILIEKNVNPHIFIAAIIASVALICSHLRKTHFEMDGYSWGLVLATVFMSVEVILQKLLLEVFSPVSLYFVRTAIMFVFFLLFYHPKMKKICLANYGLILLTAATGVGQMVLKFYGYADYGVIYTSLILILAPVIVYLLSALMLHEKLKPRTIFSVVVILLCIVYATVLGR